TATGRTHKVRRALLVGQVALTFVLLFGTALLVRSSRNLLAEDMGFVREGRVVGALRIPSAESEEASAVQARASSWLREVQGTHGVLAAAFATSIPLGGTVILEGYRGSGGSADGATPPPRAYQYYVGSQYFDALGIAFVKGRGFSEAETTSAAPVVIVDENLAAIAFGGADPVGKMLTTPDSRAGGFVKAQVVGVVRSARQQSLEEEDPYPSLYLP